MLVPPDRSIGRIAWRYLWLLSRMIWADTGAAQMQALQDAVIYGSGYISLTPQSPRTGLRDRLPVKAQRLDPASVLVHR